MAPYGDFYISPVSRTPHDGGYAKNPKTWLEAQITLINLEQAKIGEVFLPYLMRPSNKTLFETMERNQCLLPNGLRTFPLRGC